MVDNISKKTLKSERSGTGGLLFLICSALLAVCMVVTVAWTRDSTARAVAESTEHTIGLYCLASCYTHNYPTQDGISTGETTFPGLYRNKYGDPSVAFNPLTKFNEIMTAYKLMGEHNQSTKYSWSYNKTTRTFQIQFDKFEVKDNALFGIPSFVTPEPVKTVIENN